MGDIEEEIEDYIDFEYLFEDIEEEEEYKDYLRHIQDWYDE